MDKDFIKKNNLDEAIEHFKHLADYKHPKQSKKNLYEYTFLDRPPLSEEGEDGQQPQGQDMQAPQGDVQQPMGGAPDAQNQGGDMNGQMGGQMPPQGAEMPQGQDMQQPMGGDMMPPQGDMQQPPMDGQTGDTPQDGEMGDMGMPPMEDDGIETQEMEPDDEVIDVDDLTQSQEATEYKIDGVDDRLAQIFQVVQDFSNKLDKQEQSIINLKDEFEKRNPTQTEKFNLRSQASGPFNQTPTEYWDKMTRENPNYEIIKDNEVSPADEQEKYEIKRNDISGLNMRNISDTLDIDQNLKDYIGF